MFAKKSLGQNFLNSPRVVSAIVTAGELKEGDVVLEIGPGKGVLTKELLKTPAHIKTIEKDDRLIPMLSQTFEKEIHGGRLEIIHGDILEIDIESSPDGEAINRRITHAPLIISTKIKTTGKSRRINPQLNKPRMRHNCRHPCMIPIKNNFMSSS